MTRRADADTFPTAPALDLATVDIRLLAREAAFPDHVSAAGRPYRAGRARGVFHPRLRPPKDPCHLLAPTSWADADAVLMDRLLSIRVVGVSR